MVKFESDEIKGCVLKLSYLGFKISQQGHHRSKKKKNFFT